MKSAHTIGPWRYEKSTKTIRADRLIAEAPAMLAALRTVRAKHCTLDNLDDDLIAAIDAIIARIDA